MQNNQVSWSRKAVPHVRTTICGVRWAYWGRMYSQETSNMNIIGHAHHYRHWRGRCPSDLCPPHAHPHAQKDRQPAAKRPVVGVDTKTKASGVVVVPNAYLDTLNLAAEVGPLSMTKVVVRMGRVARIHGACGFVAQTLAQNERLRADIF